MVRVVRRSRFVFSHTLHHGWMVRFVRRDRIFFSHTLHHGWMVRFVRRGRCVFSRTLHHGWKVRFVRRDRFVFSHTLHHGWMVRVVRRDRFVFSHTLHHGWMVRVVRRGRFVCQKRLWLKVRVWQEGECFQQCYSVGNSLIQCILFAVGCWKKQWWSSSASPSPQLYKGKECGETTLTSQPELSAPVSQPVRLGYFTSLSHLEISYVPIPSIQDLLKMRERLQTLVVVNCFSTNFRLQVFSVCICMHVCLFALVCVCVWGGGGILIPLH